MVEKTIHFQQRIQKQVIQIIKLMRFFKLHYPNDRFMIFYTQMYNHYQMSSVFSESNEVLKTLWKEHNPQQDEYLEKEKVIEWIKNALKATNTMENVEQSLTDINGLIGQYLEEVHKVTEENTQNLSLSYTEAVDFLRWVTDTNKDDVVENDQNQQEIEPQMKEHEDDAQNENHNEMEYSSPVKQLFHKQLQQEQKLTNSQDGTKIEQKKLSSLHNQNEGQTKENQHNFKKNKTQQNIKENDEIPDKQEDEINENITNNPNEFNNDQLSKKYKDYLKVIFDHYCKASYATGQDPTFEQIMHKTTIMTINKFMMFCKDFQIAKTNPVINRNFLIEIFKKNSECYKEMSFQQFCSVFQKIANIGNEQKPAQPSQNESEEKSVLSNEMIKFLEFCEISTSKKFREKMKKLNIQYRVGPKTNAELKVVPDGYRFKFTSNNGKSQEQIKQQLNERKIHRSERRILLREKVNVNQNDLSLNKKNVEQKKKELTLIKQSKPQNHSNRIINKILGPLNPPPKKIPLLPPPPPRPTNTPSQGQISNSNANNGDVFKKQLGYAELHKIKQTEGYSRRRANTNSNTRSHDGKGTFKLNSIVEEARLEVVDLPPSNTPGHSEHLTESLATNSREETHRMKAYDMNRINNKMQEINDKIKRDREIQQELTGLLDMDNDQEDEYLMEHLQREKKNEQFGKRLSNKINQLQFK